MLQLKKAKYEPIYVLLSIVMNRWYLYVRYLKLLSKVDPLFVVITKHSIIVIMNWIELRIWIHIWLVMYNYQKRSYGMEWQSGRSDGLFIIGGSVFSQRECSVLLCCHKAQLRRNLVHAIFIPPLYDDKGWVKPGLYFSRWLSTAVAYSLSLEQATTV